MPNNKSQANGFYSPKADGNPSKSGPKGRRGGEKVARAERERDSERKGRKEMKEERGQEEREGCRKEK